MCRLFGLHAGAEPVRATFWLLKAPDSLSEQSRREPDGTGIGTFTAAGEPEISKQPIAAFEDAEFAAAARELESTTFTAHVRYATTGALTPENTHPFTQDGRIFAHNGAFAELEKIDARIAGLGGAGPDRRGPGGAGLVLGQTDSERLFALITLETRRRGGDLEAGITAAVAWIAANLPVYSLNFIITTPRQLWALRYPQTHELHVLERAPGGHGDGQPLAVDSSRIRGRSRDLAGRRSVVVATEPMDADPGWRMLGPGELLQVGPDLALHCTIPVPGAPLRRLDLVEPVPPGDAVPAAGA